MPGWIEAEDFPAVRMNDLVGVSCKLLGRTLDRFFQGSGRNAGRAPNLGVMQRQILIRKGSVIVAMKRSLYSLVSHFFVILWLISGRYSIFAQNHL